MAEAAQELAGRVALVTGSARNIGRATMLELARAGAAVVVHGRTETEEARSAFAEAKALGARAILACGDISREEEMAEVIRRAVGELGGLDIVVNNAALRKTTPFPRITLAEWRHIVGTALDGAFITSMLAVPHLIERAKTMPGTGRIFGIGGMTANKGAKGRAHVMATKAGLAGLMRGMALDLAEHGITCNTVSVGSFDTERKGSSSVVPTYQANLDIPLGRKGVPQDIAGVIRFLCGPAAAYITGQNIQVNGGAWLGL